MLCLGDGVYRLSGVPRMHERPQMELVRALRSLGYRIDTPNGKLPAVVFGGGKRPGPVVVSVDGSSQFASALLLSSRVGGWEVTTPEGSNPDELPYVEMTRRMIEVFPHQGGDFQVEPDASSASYFHAVNALFPTCRPVRVAACQAPKAEGGSGWQIDAEYPCLTPVAADAEHARDPDGKRRKTTAKAREISRKTDLGDSIMTAITIAPLASTPHSFVDLGVLRNQAAARACRTRHPARSGA